MQRARIGAEKDDTRKKCIVPGRVLLQFWSWLQPTSEQTTPQTRLVVMPAAAAVSPPISTCIFQNPPKQE